MDETEKELLKAGADAMFRPVADIATNLFGPSSRQIGLMWGDEWEHRRNARREKLDEKYAKRVRAAGFEPRLVPDYIAVPLLEASLLSEDEALQDLWANMMANAADPRNCNPVLAVFPAMLKAMSPREVKLMDHLSKHRTIRRGLNDKELELAYREAKLTLLPVPPASAHYTEQPVLAEQDANDLHVSLDILMSANLAPPEICRDDVHRSGMGVHEGLSAA